MISPYVPDILQDEEQLRIAAFLSWRVFGTRTEDQSVNSTFNDFSTHRVFLNQTSSIPSTSHHKSNLADLNENVQWQLCRPKSSLTLEDIESFLAPESYERIKSAMDLDNDGWYWGEGKAIPRSAFSTIATILTSLGAEMSHRCMTFVSPAGSIELAWSLGNGDRLSVLVPGTETGTTVQLISDLLDAGIDNVLEAVYLIRASLQESSE